MRDGSGKGLGTTGPTQRMAAIVYDRGAIDLRTRMSIEALRNLVFVLLCQDGRRVWSKCQRVYESKDNVGLVGKALLCIRSKRCSRAVCVVILPYVTLRERNAKRSLDVGQPSSGFAVGTTSQSINALGMYVLLCNAPRRGRSR